MQIHSQPHKNRLYIRGVNGLYCIILTLGGSTINILSPEGASMLRIPQDNLITKREKGSDPMSKWNKPQVKEVAVGLEINCYACAEI